VLDGPGLRLAGGELLVGGAVALALRWRLPPMVIGLTPVGFGTSMPEPATSAIAARGGQSAGAPGTILGSNAFDLLGILGATALFSPLPVGPAIRAFGIRVMLSASLPLAVPAWTGSRISRTGGLALLVARAGHIGWLGRSLARSSHPAG
jgi:cation:H+ antiporter